VVVEVLMVMRDKVGGGYDTRAGSVELALRQWLPATKEKTSTERLMAIAGRALADGTKDLRPKLKSHEREDLEAHLYEVGVRCVYQYDPDLDTGTGTVRKDVRFGRFAYVRMRHRLTDWLRDNRGDFRPGRHWKRVLEDPSSHRADFIGPEPIGKDADDGDVRPALLVEPDFVDDLASRGVVSHWSEVAARSGMSTTEWAIDRLNTMADIESREAM